MVRGNHETAAGRRGLVPFHGSCGDGADLPRSHCDYVVRTRAIRRSSSSDDAKAADPKGIPRPLVALLRSQFADVLSKCRPKHGWVGHSARFPIPCARGTQSVGRMITWRFGPLMPSASGWSGRTQPFLPVPWTSVARGRRSSSSHRWRQAFLVPPIKLHSAEHTPPRSPIPSLSGFAHMVLDRVGAVWVGTLFDDAGRSRSTIAGCSIAR